VHQRKTGFLIVAINQAGSNQTANAKTEVINCNFGQIGNVCYFVVISEEDDLCTFDRLFYFRKYALADNLTWSKHRLAAITLPRNAV
jgi:hypothetical protein